MELVESPRFPVNFPEQKKLKALHLRHKNLITKRMETLKLSSPHIMQRFTLLERPHDGAKG